MFYGREKIKTSETTWCKHLIAVSMHVYFSDEQNRGVIKMKKIISFILIQATLLMLPVHSLVQYYSFDTGIVDLSEKSNE